MGLGRGVMMGSGVVGSGGIWAVVDRKQYVLDHPIGMHN